MPVSVNCWLTALCLCPFFWCHSSGLTSFVTSNVSLCSCSQLNIEHPQSYRQKGKGKGRYSSSWEPHLRATGRHLPYGITQCYLSTDTSERTPPNPSHAGWYSIYLPRRDGRLSWPSWLDSAPAGSRTSDFSIMSPTPNRCTTKTRLEAQLLLRKSLSYCAVWNSRRWLFQTWKFWRFARSQHGFKLFARWGQHLRFKKRRVWWDEVSVEGGKLWSGVPMWALPIHLLRHFCCRMYRLATMHNVTDRQTEDSIMPITVHTACYLVKIS